MQDYNKLFDGNCTTIDDNLDELLEEDELESPRRRDRRLSSSSEKSSLSHFGPRQVCRPTCSYFLQSRRISTCIPTFFLGSPSFEVTDTYSLTWFVESRSDAFVSLGGYSVDV